MNNLAKNLSSATAFALIGAATVTQVQFLYANESGSPLTSPLTSPIVTPTPTPEPTNPSQGSNNSSNNASDQGSSNHNSAPVCNDQKPQSAPKLISAVSKKPNEVTLTWTKGKGPFNYYLVSYGLNSQANQYATNQFGDASTTSFTIQHLNGSAKYYFRVRAGNNCTPGDYSNIVTVTPKGDLVNYAVIGSNSGVLGATTAKNNVKTTVVATPAPTAVPTFLPLNQGQSGFLLWINNLISLFSRH